MTPEPQSKPFSEYDDLLPYIQDKWGGVGGGLAQIRDAMLPPVSPKHRYENTLALTQNASAAARGTGSPLAAFLTPVIGGVLNRRAKANYEQATRQANQAGMDSIVSAMSGVGPDQLRNNPDSMNALLGVMSNETIDPSLRGFAANALQEAMKPKPATKSTAPITYTSLTPEQYRQYGIPEGHPAQLSSLGKVVLLKPMSDGGFRNATPEEAQGFGHAAGQFGPDGRFHPLKPMPDGGFRNATPEEAQGHGYTSGQFGPDGRFHPLGPKLYGGDSKSTAPVTWTLVTIDQKRKWGIPEDQTAQISSRGEVRYVGKPPAGGFVDATTAYAGGHGYTSGQLGPDGRFYPTGSKLGGGDSKSYAAVRILNNAINGLMSDGTLMTRKEAMAAAAKDPLLSPMFAAVGIDPSAVVRAWEQEQAAEQGAATEGPQGSESIWAKIWNMLNGSSEAQAGPSQSTPPPAPPGFERY